MTIILGIIGLLLMIYLFWFYLRGRIMNSLIYQGLFFYSYYCYWQCR